MGIFKRQFKGRLFLDYVVNGKLSGPLGVKKLLFSTFVKHPDFVGIFMHLQKCLRSEGCYD